MHYTIHQLKIFLSIAKLGSITRAAEELHLTQPAVSIQLKNLQDQFDIPLTEHVGRKIFITGFGQEVADTAQRILNEVDNLSYRVGALKGKLSGRLKISVVSTGKYVMPYFLSGFLKENDGVDIELDVTNKSKVVESLKNNDVDFSLVSVLPEKLKVNKLGLLPNKLFLVGNKHSFRSKTIQDKTVFQDLPLIFREQGSGTRLVMERFMKTNRIPFRKKMELTGNEAVKQAVIAGMGYSVMPLIGIKNELLNGELQIIPVKGFPIRSEWNLVWLKDKGFSNVATAFIRYIKQHRTPVIRDSFSWYEKY